MFGRSESMLQRESPQGLQNFTNFNLDYQGEITEEIQVKQRRLRSNAGFYSKQNQKSRVKMIRQLKNQAYLEHKKHKRDYSLTPLLNKTSFLKNESNSEEYDSGIVNNHARSSIVHGDLYRTLEKIQAQNAKNNFVDSNRPLPHKKYSYSLPKTSFSPKSTSKIAQFTQTQRQDFIDTKPISKRVHDQKDFKFLVKTNKINDRKKNVLPNEEE